MSEFQPLIDELYREEIRAARALTPEERFREGIEISDMNLEWAATLGPEEMERRHRIACALDDHGCYGPPVPRR